MSDQPAQKPLAEPVNQPETPREAWETLEAGNQRFVGGTPLHPNQDMVRRESIAVEQKPFATFFGCSDSRLAAEIIFDLGLGDIFVVRTAGHVVDETALGSLEYSISALGVPLIVVLGHDNCGAMNAATEAYESGTTPRGYVRDIIERITPAVLAAYRRNETHVDDVGREHVIQTVHRLTERSRVIAEAVEAGEVAVVGVTYKLKDGKASVVEVNGQL